MKQVKAIIERSNDGRYSIYMDAPELPYLVTAGGGSLEDAKRDFMERYEDMKLYHREKVSLLRRLTFALALRYEKALTDYLSVGAFWGV